ncbi:MAG: hypothetical protein P4L99_28785 [Chthoniobacter sp.]|nr:hypothetical protein [Chthoniobacter sp.]
MKKALALALVALPAAALFAADPPAHIDVSKFPSQSKLIDDVVVPVPSEIFGVLDKLGKPNWVAVQRPINGVVQPTGDSPQIALMLGSVIAEGFIAVEAEDANQVKQIGKSVLNLSTPLGVGAEVKKRAQAITDAADKKDWAGVRKELDGTLDDVKKVMVKLNSEALSQLVSLGGWIRGTEALTAVVKNSYTKDGAELLHQPVLLDYFERRLAGLKPKYKANPVVTRVQKGILEIRPLIGLADGVDVSEKSVQQINGITADLTKTINSKAP